MEKSIKNLGACCLYKNQSIPQHFGRLPISTWATCTRSLPHLIHCSLPIGLDNLQSGNELSLPRHPVFLFRKLQTLDTKPAAAGFHSEKNNSKRLLTKDTLRSHLSDPLSTK